MAASFCVNAQNQTIDPTVEVNRDFQGKIMEIAKGRLNTAIADSLNIYNLDFSYSFFDKPYRDLYEFSPLPSANIYEGNSEEEYTFMAKAGIGIPFSPEAALWLTPIKGKKDHLTLGGDWNMFKTSLMKEQTYSGKGKYAHLFKWGEGDISAAFIGGSNFNILEKGTEESYEHNFNQLSIKGNMQSRQTKGYHNKCNWGVSGNYLMTRDMSTVRLKENYGILEGYLGQTFENDSQLSADVVIRGVNYGGNANYHYRLFEAAPCYKFEKGKLTVNLGAKLSWQLTNMKKTNVDRYHSFLLPDISATFNLIRNNVWVYGKVTGDNHLNTWSSLLQQNRYMNPAVSPDNIFTGSTPLDAEGGFQGRHTDIFSYRIYARYAIHKGMIQYAYNKEGGWYNAFNSNHNEFDAGADFTARIHNFLMGGEFVYASFSKGENSTLAPGLEACGKPSLRGSLHAMYNWKGGVSAGLSCKGWGSYYAAVWETAECEKIKGNADLDINVQYRFAPAFSVYLKGENILGSPSVNHPFHTGRGGCIIGGIIVKL